MNVSALLDLSKTFDSISHNLLLAKLKLFNFDMNCYQFDRKLFEQAGNDIGWRQI